MLEDTGGVATERDHPRAQILTLPPLNLGTFDIVINAGATPAGNAAALAAFNRAAQAWEAHIADSIPVTVNADLAARRSI